MKTVLFFILLSLVYINSYGQSDSNNLIASCCIEGRGCNGSAYCTACKNCSGCKHCAKNGGSCGVCSRGSNTSYRSKKSSSNSYTSSPSTVKTIYTKGGYLAINTATLNLREGPGTNYKILEKLSTSSTLIYIETSDKWLKVKVKETQTVGYVYYKYVKIK